MRIVETYSHLNGEEFLLVRKKRVFDQIKKVIKSINADKFRNKESKEKTMKGEMLYSPVEINNVFKNEFNKLGWNEGRYSYYVTTKRDIMEEMLHLDLKKQKELLEKKKIKPILSYNQTDFIKDKVAVEVQFGKYSFVAYDLFVKHMLFYTGRVIDVGVEILPMKKMQQNMSSGVAYFEGEVYNILRQGRGSPPVPLLIIGIAP